MNGLDFLPGAIDCLRAKFPTPACRPRRRLANRRVCILRQSGVRPVARHNHRSRSNPMPRIARFKRDARYVASPTDPAAVPAINSMEDEQNG